MTRPILALQLYTLRDDCARDMLGTLRQVAALGYEAVELAGYGNASAREIQPVLKETGLKVIGSHLGFQSLQDDLDVVIAEAELLDFHYAVCPSVPAELRTAQGYADFGQQLNTLGARLKAAGIQLCYHNHNFEFDDRFDGVYGLDLLYRNSDPQLVQAEVDVYWVRRGGADPVAYLKQHAGRVPLVHAKDMAPGPGQEFAEVGNGILDWPGIFAASTAGGAVAYIVEQDTCPGAPIDSVRQSIENLRRMLG